MKFIYLILAFVLWCCSVGISRADTTIVADGKPRAAIFVHARIMDDAAANPEPSPVWKTLKPEAGQRRLRESVKDLAAIIERMSGAKLDIVSGAPAADEKRLPILIGEVATARFGKPAKAFPYQQGFRLVMAKDTIGLTGESDLATSYAIYTLLDSLGCRWYMPGPHGEVLPALKTISLAEQDVSTGPYTVYRGLWYCDNDFARRNRLGGMELSAGHAIEQTVPKELRKEHPEIRAIVGGKPDEWRVKWTHPLVAKSLADSFLAQLEKDPTIPTFSLSPDDGITWDESDDAKLDAGDFDPATQTTAKADRLMVLTNRVAEQVSAKYPQVKFGVLAYVDYTRPPVREKVHPAVVPQIAPITFSRAHPMTDEGEPNSAALRYLVEGWGKAAPATSYYFYGYYLAEVSSPNPLITKWGVDVPYVMERGNCRYWQPETITNFETSLHGHYLGMRLAWDPSQRPAAIFSELHDKFYGHAAREMEAYWQFIDQAWVQTPEYAGCGFGHLRRWTAERMTKARELMNLAAAACRTDDEKFRVQLASDSLAGFELFMKLRRDLADGRFGQLAVEAEQYRKRMIQLGEQHQKEFAFAMMGWTGERTLNVVYFDAFYKATYDDASRVARDFTVLSTPPLRKWRFLADKEKQGEAAGWYKVDFDDAAWKTTDCAVDTWSSLGLHNHMGSLWYRTQVDVPAIESGKKVRLWLSATDGRVKVFVNGKHIPYVNPKGETADTFSGFCEPASFDVTAAIKPGAKNQISLLCTREFLNELGTGGLLSPAVIYRDK